MLRLALRYLLARPRQSLLMLLGVLLGTAAFIALSGLLLGFKEYLVDQLVNNSASVIISAPREGGTLRDPGAWGRRLAADPLVAATCPQLGAPALLSRGGATASGVLLGCDPAGLLRVTRLASYATAGSFAALRGRELAVGDSLASRAGLTLGSRVRVSCAGGASETFRVAALFKTGVERADSVAYAPLGAVQALLGRPGAVGDIAVRLKDYTRADGEARAFNRLGGCRAESWERRNATLISTFKAEDMVRFLSLGAVLLVAGFGITNVLHMTVVQKRMDIAILRSLGYRRGDILALFLWQGLVLGLAGVALGCLAGWGAGLYLRTVSIGGNPMGAGTGHLAVSLAPRIFLEGGLFALAAACVSTALPAWSAARLEPIEIIRAGAA